MYSEHLVRKASLRVHGPWKNSPVTHPVEGKVMKSCIPRQNPGVGVGCGVGVGVALQASSRLMLARTSVVVSHAVILPLQPPFPFEVMLHAPSMMMSPSAIRLLSSAPQFTVEGLLLVGQLATHVYCVCQPGQASGIAAGTGAGAEDSRQKFCVNEAKISLAGSGSSSPRAALSLVLKRYTWPREVRT